MTENISATNTPEPTDQTFADLAASITDPEKRLQFDNLCYWIANNVTPQDASGAAVPFTIADMMLWPAVYAESFGSIEVAPGISVSEALKILTIPSHRETGMLLQH